MTVPVFVAPKALDEYEAHVGAERLAELRALAAPLEGARVLHLNATSFGGGVAEILNSFIPLLRDLGVDAEWRVMQASAEFFNVSKSMHNALQGMYIPWNKAMADLWRETNAANAETLDGAYDFVYVHDPQPAGVLAHLRERDPDALGAKWLWRCHLDTTDALPEVWNFLKGYVSGYDALVFTLPEYVKEPIPGPLLEIIWPAIDPASAKNSEIPAPVVRDILARYEIDPDRPIIAQISRFDPWKDPLGVLDVYRILKERRPGLQLLMVAAMANDDPEAWSFYERIVRKAGEDFDIHVLTNLNGVGNLEVNAFQRAADVLLQKSIREGFGLVISEALWKAKALVGSEAGGIPLQLDYGRAGAIAGTTQEFADAIGGLLDDPGARKRLGRAGKERVRDQFLTTRLLNDHLRLMGALANGAAPTPTKSFARRRRGAVSGRSA